MNPSAWNELAAALDRLARSGRTARFWWRDDDAVAATPQLDRLIATAEQFGVPLLLAVIPAAAGASLARRLAGQRRIAAAVHGFAHVNHAGLGEKKQELGAHRPVGAVLAELVDGRVRLEQLMGDRLLPVLVPPWNRIAPRVVERLRSAGFAGLSVFGPEDRVTAPEGITVVNTDLDPIDWHGDRSLSDLRRLVTIAADHVNGCTEGRVDRALGLLTHHLIHDEAVWAFVDQLLTMTAAHPACRWCDPRSLFGG